VGVSDILMGYRESGPERDIVMMRYAGRCIFCGHKVYVVPSGFDVLKDGDSDAKMACNICYNDPDLDIDRYMGDY
jgi:transcription elongation factor Elf1